MSDFRFATNEEVSLREQVAELKQQRDELRRDAERYRWLRKNKAAPCDYDTAIDAAIAKTKKQI